MYLYLVGAVTACVRAIGAAAASTLKEGEVMDGREEGAMEGRKGREGVLNRGKGSTLKEEVMGGTKGSWKEGRSRGRNEHGIEGRKESRKERRRVGRGESRETRSSKEQREGIREKRWGRREKRKKKTENRTCRPNLRELPGKSTILFI